MHFWGDAAVLRCETHVLIVENLILLWLSADAKTLSFDARCLHYGASFALQEDGIVCAWCGPHSEGSDLSPRYLLRSIGRCRCMRTTVLILLIKKRWQLQDTSRCCRERHRSVSAVFEIRVELWYRISMY